MGQRPTEHLAATFASVAHELFEPDADDAFERIVHLGTDLVDGADHCSVTVERRRRWHTAAASDAVSEFIDLIQYEVEEGPSIEVSRSEAVHEVADVERDTRWRHFLRRTHQETPVRSILSSQLVLHDRAIGSLNLYADEVDAFDDRAREVAFLLSTHAAVALAAASEITNLRRAIESRDHIATAKGILMQREGVSEDEAFAILRNASRRSNVRLVDLAIQIVDGLPR